MAEILKPSNLSLTWASGGDVLNPGDTKYATGWQVEIPPRQWFNYLDNRQDTAIAHLNQHGIAVWDETTEYQEGKSYVTGSNGKVYLAVQTHTNQNPTTDITETYWTDVMQNGFAVLTTSQSWTVPAILRMGLKKVRVEVIGAGGGGARSTTLPGPTGGSQGGSSFKLVDLTGVSSVVVTVGAGGAGGASDPSNGVAGGNSSFGAFCSAAGGAGGVIISSSPSGGSGVGGDYNVVGGSGSIPVMGASGSFAGGAGGGGSSPLGNVGAGTAPAKGHGGAGRTANAGVAGADGIVIIQW